MAITAGFLAAGVGLSLLSGMLSKKPGGKGPLRDDKPNNPSQRGSFIPLVIGTRRVGAVVCAVGDRYVTDSTPSGKGLASGGADTFLRYYESAVHAWCVGPVSEIRDISADGKIIAAGPYTPISHPTATTIHVPRRGDMAHFYGSCDQDGEVTLLPDLVGAESLFPHICRSEWFPMRLGAAPRWPSMESTVTARIDGASPIQYSSAWLEGSGVASGVNGAHALYQLLTATYPHGCGIPAELFDLTAFEDLGGLCEDEGFAVNILAKDGIDGTAQVASLMVDMGIMLPQDGRVLVPVPIRPWAESGAPPELDADAQAAPEPEINEAVGERAVDRAIYLFPDEAHNYRSIDAAQPDDSQAAPEFGRQKVQTFNIENVTNFTLAAIVADRRQQEVLTNTATFTFHGLRGSRLLRAGSQFTHPLYGSMRVTAMYPDGAIEAIRDGYGVEQTGEYLPGPPDPAPPVTGDDLEPDAAFRAFELPAALVGSTTTMIVMRSVVSAMESDPRAAIWISGDGTSYTQIGFQNSLAITGTIDDGMDSDPADIPDTPGLQVTYEMNPAYLEPAMDLTGDPTRWAAGAQWLIVDDEIMYLSRIAGVLGGIKRGMLGTTVATHAPGVRFWVINPDLMTRFTNALIASGETRYVKAQPFNDAGEVDLADVTPDVITFV